ncbi:hypothetical protein SAMN04488514_104204 [Kriegella aquimaris]|uniref:Uncharacterized protein n=1 Tax=Kriegella aquimaris TaxID=192904 RepID=A0A1G9PXC9_9FLAO|nr:hypothetical protein SAMN04488514_104204 [Kriegella aquimaris]
MVNHRNEIGIFKFDFYLRAISTTGGFREKRDRLAKIKYLFHQIAAQQITGRLLSPTFYTSTI